jgi:hypothetical protein
MGTRRGRLDQLTDRWRVRHDARRPDPATRPQADAERERLALSAFPYREQSPRDYAEHHADDMVGFTYDEYRYHDPDLDAWLLELGRLLQERRSREGESG